MMTIEETIFITPIPKSKKFLDSSSFLEVLAIKYSRVHKLILKENTSDQIIDVLSDLESTEHLITNSNNLTCLHYMVGTKYTELGLKYAKDEYLVTGIRYLNLIDENFLATDALKADYYRLYSRGMLIHFNNELEKDQYYRYSFENIEPLLKSKYFLFKLYNFSIEKKIRLSTVVEARIISDLISVLIFLSRWNEPFFILDRRNVVSDYNPKFLNYLKALTLNEIAWNTCCSIYPSMVFEIKKFIKGAKTPNGMESEWKGRLTQVNKEVDEVIENHKIDLEEFKRDYGDPKKDLEEHGEYRKWVLKNHFALCEHSLYCFCGLSSTDDLKIKSDHEHTQIQWVEQFDILLEKIKGDFNLTRYFLFISENDSKLNYIRDEEIKDYFINESIINNSNSDYLIQAFKSAYSILDKIGRAIYLALEIKQKDIYFHNCWKKIKETNLGDHNRYLIALYSIACDLSDTSKYSAFKEYKDWRNLIEHEFFFLIKEDANIEAIKQEFTVIKGFVKIDEFKEKTHYMLQLCRSAIFFLRFFYSSRIEEKRN